MEGPSEQFGSSGRMTSTEYRQATPPGTTNSEFELDIKALLKQIDESLGGAYYEVNYETGKVTKCINPQLALVNETGLQYIKSRITILANPWTALSIVEETYVREFTLQFADTMRQELRARHEEFGVKRHNFGTLILALSALIYLSLSKSIGGGERTYRRGTVERFVESFEKGKRSLTDTLTGMFKKGD